MKHFKTGLMMLACGAMTACALPGMKYEEGGSRVWHTESDTRSFNTEEPELSIYKITPSLLSHMAADPDRKNPIQPPLRPSPESWEYRVGPGDILSVIVWDHPELTNPAGTTQSVSSSGRVVQPDGTMFYPHVGVIQVAGKSIETIRQMIRDGLAPVVEDPQVDVRVLEFRSQYVNIVGDVEQPCRLTVTDTPLTVVQAMNQCPTINPAIGNRSLVLARNGDRRTVDLHSVYRGEDPLLNQPLRGGDTLYVQDNRWNRVFVVGEVMQQAAINIPVSGMTLAEALSAEQVQGINQVTADAGQIYVFRGGTEKLRDNQGQVTAENYQPEIYHLNAESADALLLADQFELKPRDIVYVSSASLVGYSRAASLVIPTITTLLQSGILIDRINQ